MPARALPVTTKRSQLRLRMLRLGGEDFDLVAIVEDCAQRHDPSVDLGTDRLVAKIGMDRIGEVDRGRALGQLDQLALAE